MWSLIWLIQSCCILLIILRPFSTLKQKAWSFSWKILTTFQCQNSVKVVGKRERHNRCVINLPSLFLWEFKEISFFGISPRLKGQWYQYFREAGVLLMHLASILTGTTEGQCLRHFFGRTLWYLDDEALSVIGKDLLIYLLSRSIVVYTSKNIHLPI